MTVRDLIAELRKFDPSLPVITFEEDHQPRYPAPELGTCLFALNGDPIMITPLDGGIRVVRL